MSTSIAMVCIHYGRLPKWFDYFLLSCKANHEYDWYIIINDTVTKLPVDTPANVYIINEPVEQFNKRASRCFNISYKLTNPYTICDFRPAIGTMYRDFLHAYKYWGHCDMDIILGKLGSFLSWDVMSEYDIITTRGRSPKTPNLPRFSGPMTIYTNNYKCNTLYTKYPNYRSIITCSTYKQFDEIIIATLARSENLKVKDNIYIFNYPHSLAIKRWKYSKQPFPYEKHPGLLDDHHRWVWNSGNLYFRNYEIGYLHFGEWKNNESFISGIIQPQQDVSKFTVHSTGISPTYKNTL
jgi:hypothetical protein